MSQGDAALLRSAQELEESVRAFYARARQVATDEFLAATFHFLETQHALALQQLDDERLRLEGPRAPTPAES
ncbi:MAG TPA: hypothetical protein VEI97_18275 [bacterium]|nr:hypothetical protein [bacterium]